MADQTNEEKQIAEIIRVGKEHALKHFSPSDPIPAITEFGTFSLREASKFPQTLEYKAKWFPDYLKVSGKEFINYAEAAEKVAVFRGQNGLEVRKEPYQFHQLDADKIKNDADHLDKEKRTTLLPNLQSELIQLEKKKDAAASDFWRSFNSDTRSTDSRGDRTREWVSQSAFSHQIVESYATAKGAEAASQRSKELDNRVNRAALSLRLQISDIHKTVQERKCWYDPTTLDQEIVLATFRKKLDGLKERISKRIFDGSNERASELLHDIAKRGDFSPSKPIDEQAIFANPNKDVQEEIKQLKASLTDMSTLAEKLYTDRQKLIDQHLPIKPEEEINNKKNIQAIENRLKAQIGELKKSVDEKFPTSSPLDREEILHKLLDRAREGRGFSQAENRAIDDPNMTRALEQFAAAPKGGSGKSVPNLKAEWGLAV